MKTVWRTLDAARRRSMLVTALTVALIGVSYGATAVSAGLPVWFPVVSAATVVAGASEFVLVGVVAAGGGAIAAAATGLVLNLRHLPYGISVHDAVGTGWRRLPGSHLLNDESVAFTLAEDSLEKRRAALRVCGVAILVSWPAGTLLGAAVGALVPNPDAFGLDAVFPAVLATLALPKLTGRVRVAALVGAAIALATDALLPAGVPILLSLLGLVALAVPRRPQDDRPAST